MDYDLIAKKIENYFKKLAIEFRYTQQYYNLQHEMIDATMSCDLGECVMFYSSVMKGLIHLGTTPSNRTESYVEFIAAYDMYESLIKKF